MESLSLDLSAVLTVDQRPRAVSVRECVASFAQQRLWFFEQMQPGTSVLHMSIALKLRGALNTAALERACEGIQSRHETLRTVFAERNGELVQVISPSIGVPLEQADLRGLSEGPRSEALGRITAECAGQPFDLAHGPVWRARLVRIGDQDHRLLVCLHHLVCDGLSRVIFLRELGTLYKAHCDDVPNPSLPALAWQYGDFADWQRKREHDEAIGSSLNYWVEQLRDAPATLELPTDRPYPAIQAFRGGAVSARLDKSLTWRLERLGRDRGATLFMVLLAGFSALMARLSGQDDLVVGAPVAGRSRPDLEPLIGLFINTLPLRMNLGGNPTFRTLLDRTRTTACDAFEHQAVPFEQIVAAVRPDRARSNTPLFQVLFNMQQTGGGSPAAIGGVVAELEGGFDLASKFDLTVYATQRTDGVELGLVYNADLFDRARMEEMAAQYQQLLTQVVANPDAELAAIDLRTPAACRRLPDPSATLNPDGSGSIVNRLAEHARRTPERPAVTSPEGTWTYRDLDRRTDVLAARLREHGIGAGDVVAIYAHRSAPLVLSLIGVMKAGAAFCILDPRHPHARLSACVRAATPAALIRMTRAGDVAAELQHDIDALCRATIEVGDDYGIDARSTPAAIETPLDPDRLTYVAFTSGSTGGVKAIAGSERPLAHFLDWHTRTFGLTADDAFSVLSGLAHDPLLRDILAPLWVGGRVEMPPDVDLRDSDAIAAWMAERSVSVAHVTPPMARLLSDAAERASIRFPSLRRVFFAGDTLTPTVVDRVRAVAPHAECVNFYGATETPQAMGFWRVPFPTPAAIALGDGIDDAQLLVLGAHGRLVGVGEPGEICIRTPYLSQGYRGDPELTRDRFVENPFTGNPLDRVYRTGDIGRYRPDGSVEFVCRRDTQIKVRGFRVELHEVERALLQHPAIADAAAVAGTAEDGDRHVIAYCVHKTEPVSPKALRVFLESVLPEYAIPARIVSIARLPITANGKIDRAALSVAESRGTMFEEYVAPATATERALARIWGDLLGVDRIGVQDGFFDRGGHSLLGMRVIARVRDQLGVDLPLRTLFEFPTIAALAGIMDQQLIVQTPAVSDSGEREEIEL